MNYRGIVHVAVDPDCAARSSVYRPENHHEAEAQPRPEQPHRQSAVNQNAAQPWIGVNRKMTRSKQVPLVKDSEVSKAIRTEEYIDNCCDDGEPNAPELSWDEALHNATGGEDAL